MGDIVSLAGILNRNVWHAGAACVELQACAANVWYWVQECDFIKDSFAWHTEQDTPAVINRDQHGTLEHLLFFFLIDYS